MALQHPVDPGPKNQARHAAYMKLPWVIIRHESHDVTAPGERFMSELGARLRVISLRQECGKGVTFSYIKNRKTPYSIEPPPTAPPH